MGDTGREELQGLGAFWECAQKITTWGKKTQQKHRKKSFLQTGEKTDGL